MAKLAISLSLSPKRQLAIISISGSRSNVDSEEAPRPHHVYSAPNGIVLNIKMF